MFAIESLANFLEKFEENTALDGIAQTPIKLISQFDSILSVWQVFTSLESFDDLTPGEFITLAIAVVDFGGKTSKFDIASNVSASFLLDGSIEDFVQFELVSFLRELQDQGKS